MGELAIRAAKNAVYDFVVGSTKIDVKCKFRRVTPSLQFEASFFASQATPYYAEVDAFVFMSTIPRFAKVCLCGFISKAAMIAHPAARLWKKGESDPTNAKVFHEDTWSVPYTYLNMLPPIRRAADHQQVMAAIEAEKARSK